MKKKAFLDTSILISREFGSPYIKQKIEQKIGKMEKYATTFTKAEINRSIMKDAVLLYSLLFEEMGLQTVFRRLQKFPFTERRRKRCLALLEKISNKRQLRLADAITRLESLITGLYVLLFNEIKLTVSNTNCQLIEAEPKKHNKIYTISVSCTKQTAKCNLEQFLETNKDDLKKISIEDNVDEKLIRVLNDVFDNASTAKGRNCFKLGDIIICLESPRDYVIYSTNIHDFESICKALQKQFIGIK